MLKASKQAQPVHEELEREDKYSTVQVVALPLKHSCVCTRGRGPQSWQKTAQLVSLFVLLLFSAPHSHRPWRRSGPKQAQAHRETE